MLNLHPYEGQLVWNTTKGLMYSFLNLCSAGSAVVYYLNRKICRLEEDLCKNLDASLDSLTGGLVAITIGAVYL